MIKIRCTGTLVNSSLGFDYETGVLRTIIDYVSPSRNVNRLQLEDIGVDTAGWPRYGKEIEIEIRIREKDEEE